MNVAETILAQIKETVGMNVYFSWGAHALKSMTQENLESLDINNGRGALLFRVSGHHYKGQVLVVLNGKDLYDIYFCSIRVGTIKISEKVTDLYFDQIGDFIDKKVEYISEYVS